MNACYVIYIIFQTSTKRLHTFFITAQPLYFSQYYPFLSKIVAIFLSHVCLYLPFFFFVTIFLSKCRVNSTLKNSKARINNYLLEFTVMLNLKICVSVLSMKVFLFICTHTVEHQP